MSHESLVVPVTAALLHPENATLAAIPAHANPIIMEVGTSDRDTLDLELHLPELRSAFLISFEPMLDKYSRALSRREASSKVQERAEPLGQHHERGLILPMAIGPTANAVGELQTLHVSPIAGCSSLKRSNRMRGSRSNSRLPANESNRQTFSFFCRPVAEERRVWVVPLKQALLWVGRPIAFLKVDAQGGDLEAVLSGGDLLHTRVERLASLPAHEHTRPSALSIALAKFTPLSICTLSQPHLT